MVKEQLRGITLKLRPTHGKSEYVIENESQTFKEHFERYKFASEYTKNRIVLDIACGSGYGTDYLMRNGAKKVIGADISENAIKTAREKYLGEFQVMNAIKLDFQDNYFDCVVSFETIEHLIEYKLFLDEIRRVTKNNGTVIMSTPNYVFELVKFKYHVSSFRKKDFIELFNEYFSDTKFFGQSKWFLAFPGRGHIEKIFKPKRDSRIFELEKFKFRPQDIIAVGINKKGSSPILGRSCIIY